jgi:transposase
VAERVRVRGISNQEGNRLLRIVRRSTGSVVTWRRAQMVLLSAQGMDVAQIAQVTFTSPDRVREVLHNFNLDGFDSLYPRYRGGRPPTFTLAQRRAIKQLALSRPQDHDLPFSTWSLAKLADFLVAEGVVDDISHEGLRVLLRQEGVSFQRLKTWKQSHDPDFEAKKNRILHLYGLMDGTHDVEPGDPDVVFCVDEFGPLNLQPHPGLWVPKTPFISCGLGILMDQPAESIQPHDAFAGRWIGFGDGSERWRLTECAVRPVLVVVRQVARQHFLEMPLTQDQHPVEQLTTYGADPAFGERIRSRRTHRRPQDSDALGGEDRIEGVGELRVSVADEELELDLLSAVGEVHDQVAGLLGHPRSGRVRRHAQDMNPAGRQLHHEQCIQALEQDRVDMKEVARHNPLGLRRQELSPRQPRAAGCRVDAGPLENQPHGTRRDRVPEPGELTLDASVAPGRVLRCHPQDQAT